MEYNVPKVGEWTEARYWQFIRSLLRKGWNKYPVKYKVLNAARRPSQRGGKRIKWEFCCNICKEWWLGSEVTVDHIIPCGSLNNFLDLPRFCWRLFCGEENLQVLCKDDHDNKTYCDNNPGIRWEQAKKERQIKAYLKLKVPEQKSVLTKAGFSPEEISNKLDRSKCFRRMVDESK